MASNQFSKSLQQYKGEIDNPYLRDSIRDLFSFLGKKNINLLSWDENNIAIPIKIKVELPPLGNYNNIDIKETENVILVLNLKNYPSTVPIVFTDRLNFPKAHLAHLYIAKANRPPAFCLVRGSIKEWYSNKRLPDLIIRTKNWFRDAVTGELNANGDQFEPLRLEGYQGTIIYQYQQFANIVNNSASFLDNSNFSVALFEDTSKENEYPAFRLEKIVNQDQYFDELKKYLESLKRLIENKSFNAKKLHFGYILWAGTDNMNNDYYVDLPRSWESFQVFCSKYNIELTDFEYFITESDFNFFNVIPVIVAIRRPKQIIGYSSTLEFVNFFFELKKEDKIDHKIVNNIPISFQSHNEPLSTEKAKLISGKFPKIKDSLIVGCGALGSKITMHFIRSGCTDFLLLDNDSLSPHNLVRHSLLPEYEGVNKATALSSVIRNMYRNEELNEMISIPTTAESFFNIANTKILPYLKWIFDFTASESFLNYIVNNKTLIHLRICRASIYDQGGLGILLFEGPQRNPRLDDLIIMLYSQYSKYPFISDWLQRETNLINSGNTILNVGVGCNSETTILSDEIISSHAAYFAGAIKHNSNKNLLESKGFIYLNRIIDNEEYQIDTQKLTIDPFIELKAINDPSWELRIRNSIIIKIRSEMGIAMPFETGGVFIGCSNYKTKTIHVIDIITAPSDSMTNQVCFYRGIHGLPEKVKEINEGSGFQLGYIGEWHTHPFGPDNMSAIDMNSVKKFKKEFEQLSSPLPVFLLIATPNSILTYVY
jgi:hypothetical protein